jgi:drug/metabolite transporter (DMT)-like permease
MTGGVCVARTDSTSGPGVFTLLIPATFVLAWSTAYVVGDLGVRSTPPFTLTFLRFAAATLCMVVVALVTRARWPRTRQEFAHIAAAGILVQGVQFLGVYGGFKLGVPAALSSLVIGINPVLTALLARPVLGERATPRQRWGFLLGVVLAVAQGLDFSSGYLAGIGFTLLGLLAISGGTVYQKRFCPNMDLRSGNVVQLAAATVLAGVCAFAFEDVHTDNAGVFAFTVGWLALINSIGAVSLLYVMIRRGEAGRASTLFFLVPSVTAVIATVTLDEALSVYAVAGFVVAAAGVLMATFRTRSSGATAEPKR